MKVLMMLSRKEEDSQSLLLKSFGKWKRLELSLVLGGLKAYQAALDSKSQHQTKKSVPKSLLQEPDSQDSSLILNSIGNKLSLPKKAAAFASHQ